MTHRVLIVLLGVNAWLIYSLVSPEPFEVLPLLGGLVAGVLAFAFRRRSNIKVEPWLLAGALASVIWLWVSAANPYPKYMVAILGGAFLGATASSSPERERPDGANGRVNSRPNAAVYVEAGLFILLVFIALIKGGVNRYF